MNSESCSAKTLPRVHGGKSQPQMMVVAHEHPELRASQQAPQQSDINPHVHFVFKVH